MQIKKRPRFMEFSPFTIIPLREPFNNVSDGTQARFESSQTRS